MRGFGLIVALWCAFPASAQSPPAFDPSAPAPAPRQGIIRQIEFIGLRRVAPQTLRAHISSREGDPLDSVKVQEDVRALDRLGWFDAVTAEAHALPVLLAHAGPAGGPAFGALEALPLSPSLRLVFVLRERPVLAAVEFTGSRALQAGEIDRALAAAGIRLKLAGPVDRTGLWRAGKVIRALLAERARPLAEVRLRLDPVPTEAVRAVYEIADGPEVEVAQVFFEGNHGIPDGKLRSQMKRVAPGALLAGLRDRKVYTSERLEEDLRRLEHFYRNQGYPEARLGPPRVDIVDHDERHWLPWPRTRAERGFRIVIPVEEGPFYRFAAVDFVGASARVRSEWQASPEGVKPGAPYSLEKLFQARQRLNRVQVADGSTPDASRTELVVVQQFDERAGTVGVTFRAREAEPYIVRRIDFVGHYRFSDRYYRKRIRIAEGQPFDAARLEQGLAALASGGFIRPVTAGDIDLALDETRRTADLTIRIEEVGRQRFSLLGGAAGLGSTLGIAYNVFDLLGAEELLTAHFEGGPQALAALVGVAKEGLFGTRASMGLSLYRNVLRPAVAGPRGRERLFTSGSTGLAGNWTYALTRRDSLTVQYQAASAATRVPLASAELLPAEAGDNLLLRSARRSLGLGWSHQGQGERFEAVTAYSGGALGGDQDVVRGSMEYARLEADPLTGGRNTWAVRGFLAGVGSHSRRALPLEQRFFAGEQFVRGFRTGELAPYAVVQERLADGATRFHARPAGASLLFAGNAEYRIPLRERFDLAAFADFGAGWLLPRWLGGGPAAILAPTNGVLRASTGLELSFRVPLLNQPLRVYGAFNPLRLAESLLLPDGTLFRSRERRFSLGFSLGPFF